MGIERARAAQFIFGQLICGSMMVACSSSAPAASVSGADAGAAETSTPDAGGADAAAAADTSTPAPVAGNCDVYCTTVMQACTHIGDGYPNTDICLANCNALPLGVVGDHEDTVGCRQGHALAAAAAPFEECPLAGPFPPKGCGDPCDAFCKLATAACGDSWQGHCAADCAKWPANPDGVWSSSGDNLSCRQTNVERAFERDPDLGDAGGGCGSVTTNSAECK